MVRTLVPGAAAVLLLTVACADGDAPVTETDTPTPEPAIEEAATPESPGSSTEVIELQSSGSLRFDVVAGRVDGGWCAHLVDADDPAVWSAQTCTISTAAAETDGISYAIAEAPADPEVQVLYGLVGPAVAKIAVDFQNGSTSSSIEAGPSRRAELDGLGSFSAIMRPSMGTPVRVRVLDESGGELKAIDL